MKSGRAALFILLSAVGAVLASPLVVEGQQPGRVPRVGVFVFTPALREAFVQGLREAGYVEGQNIIVEYRIGAASQGVTLEKQIEELLALKVDVIVGSAVVIATVKKASPTVPIVAIDFYGDPIASGFVATYARPAGNVTGVFLDMPELAGKHLELLRELLPGLSRVAVLSGTSYHEPHLRAIEAAARSANVTIRPVSVRGDADLGEALDNAVRERPQALIAVANAILHRNRKQIADAALKQRLPTITVFTNFPEVGGLIGYGPNFPDFWRRGASYVDRILKGAKPGDLPIERPTKFELVINLKTAKALGLTIPPSLLLRADHVIE
jgi:putative ABC transport system substrate-binding protein